MTDDNNTPARTDTDKPEPTRPQAEKHRRGNSALTDAQLEELMERFRQRFG